MVVIKFKKAPEPAVIMAAGMLGLVTKNAWQT
jgi:hypothetical protein